jgi:glycosyltransferase involved in cell wall biosynthesis
VAEVVQHEVTGILTRTDHQALARAVIRMLVDEQLRREMGARARLWASAQFGPERLVSDIEQLYESTALARGWWQVAHKSSAPEEITR